MASPVQYLLGELAFSSFSAPVVCDLLDAGDWRGNPTGSLFESSFARRSAGVMAVSQSVLEEALQVNPRAVLVPNGVEVQRYRNFDMPPSECKKRLGLKPSALTVSLIGLTCSARLYFIEAVLRMAQAGHNLQLLLVGEGNLAPRMRALAGQSAGRVVFAGRVDYEQLLPYFGATDVGLYPCDDHAYFHNASPLKVLEYSAMGRRVLISPPLKEMLRLNLANFMFCDATSVAVQDALERVNATIQVFDERVLDFDWSRIAARAESFLENIAASSVSGDRRAPLRP